MKCFLWKSIRLRPVAALVPAAAGLAVMVMLAALAGVAAASDEPLPGVLTLHSYHQGSPRTDGLARGIGRALTVEGKSTPQMVVYLDADRLGTSPDYPKILEATRNTLSVMIQAASPKVIIVTDWTALGFWREHRESLAPGLPVVYCGIGFPPPAWVSGMENVTGVVERLALGETLEAAMRLVPRAKKVLVLETSAPYFTVLRAQLERELKPFEGRIGIQRFQDQDIHAVEKRLSTLDKDWIVLAVGRPELNGIALTSASASQRISSASPVPVFATWQTWVGHGAVGGRVMSSEEQGFKAGKMTMAILGGSEAKGLPAVREDTGTYLFDHLALKRFNIAGDMLPPGSVIVNKPVSFYEQNKQLVWLYGVVTALLFLVSGVLALYTAYKRRTQNELAAQVNFVGSLMEAMPTPVFYKDAKGIYLGCNRAMEAFTGIDRARLVGRTVHELYPKEEADVFKKQDDALFASGPVQIYEFEKSTPAGPRQIRFHKALYHDAEGGAAGLVGVIADITDLRKAELEVERTRNYLQAIIDSSPSAIFGVDLEGNITHSNLRARELCAGPSIRKFEEALPRIPDAMEKIRLAITGGESVALPRQITTVDGKLLAEDVMIYPLHAIGLAEAVVRVDDVTGRHRMEELVVQSEKMMSVGGLAAGMAHEINNPLGGVMQSAQVIAKRMEPRLPANVKAAGDVGVSMEAVRAYLDHREIPILLDGLRESAKRAAGIVANMLEFSRRSTSAWLPVDVNTLAEKSIELCLQDYNLSQDFDFKRIGIIRDYDPKNPSVPCSSQQIQQVIFNLLRNAAQAMYDAGTPDPSITISTRQERDCVVIEVADNGPGMEESVRRKAFEPFFTTKSPGNGTGLGLSVSYFIVRENHGGEIEVESEPGKGARFMVSLPLKNHRCA
ncbi:MAG: ABC transporter substrate binding protein [Thermodesulfobacteriota bacterium]